MVASTEQVTPGAKTYPSATGSNDGVFVCVTTPVLILKVYELEATPPVIVNIGESPVQIVRLA